MQVQLATGVGVFDFLAVTEDFTAAGRMPYVDLMHVTGTASKTSNLVLIGVVLALIAALTFFLIRRRP